MDTNSNLPNQAGSSMSSWRLTRRFFLLDTLSGIEGTGNFIAGGTATVIRYAVQASL